MNKKWTEEEKAKVQKLVDLGMPPWGIAEILKEVLGRSKRSVEFQARKQSKKNS